MLFLIEGDPSYQMLFIPDQILFLAEVIAFWNLENTGNYSTRTDFNRDFPKILDFRNDWCEISDFPKYNFGFER